MNKIFPRINLQFFTEEKPAKVEPKKGKEDEVEPAKQADPNEELKALVKTLTDTVSSLTTKNQELVASVGELKAKQEKFEEVYKDFFSTSEPKKTDDDPNIAKTVDVMSHIVSVKDY